MCYIKSQAEVELIAQPKDWIQLFTILLMWLSLIFALQVQKQILRKCLAGKCDYLLTTELKLQFNQSLNKR
jgi:hypothetical protein